MESLYLIAWPAISLGDVCFPVKYFRLLQPTIHQFHTLLQNNNKKWIGVIYSTLTNLRVLYKTWQMLESPEDTTRTMGLSQSLKAGSHTGFSKLCLHCRLGDLLPILQNEYIKVQDGREEGVCATCLYVHVFLKKKTNPFFKIKTLSGKVNVRPARPTWGQRDGGCQLWKWYNSIYHLLRLDTEE